MGKWLDNRTKQTDPLLATATLQPNQFHTYYTKASGFTQSKKFIENKVNLKANRPAGELSHKAQKRIQNAINWLLIRSKPQRVYNRQHDKAYFFRVNFITLTLPAKQCHSDKEIVSVCLNNFLNILRKQAGVVDYLWKAEAQGNGNIHFHITSNQFIHYNNIRKWWCSSVQLLGYVDKFQAKFHHRNPPCTEIRKVKHIRRLAAYLSKYLAKNKSFSPIGELRKVKGKIVEVLYTSKLYRDEASNKKQGEVIGTVLSEKLRLLECNLWGCSQSISKCVPMRFDCNSVQWEQFTRLLHSGKFKCVKGDFVNSYYGNVYHTAKELAPAIWEDMNEHAKGGVVSQSFTDDKILQYLE